MRYWAFFAAKLVVAAGFLLGLLAIIDWAWPPERPFFDYLPPRFGYNLGFTTAVMVWFIICAATFYLVIWDQRYRCRVCLRRLRMPVETGSWDRMLQLGRPRIEYICVYGHGTLRESEFQISGLENPEWQPHSDDMWAELENAADSEGDRKL